MPLVGLAVAEAGQPEERLFPSQWHKWKGLIICRQRGQAPLLVARSEVEVLKRAILAAQAVHKWNTRGYPVMRNDAESAKTAEIILSWTEDYIYGCADGITIDGSVLTLSRLVSMASIFINGLNGLSKIRIEQCVLDGNGVGIVDGMMRAIGNKQVGAVAIVNCSLGNHPCSAAASLLATIGVNSGLVELCFDSMEDFSDEILKEFSKLWILAPGLKTLRIKRCPKLRGEYYFHDFLKGIKENINLDLLDLSRNSLDWSILNPLIDVVFSSLRPNITKIDLSYNNLTPRENKNLLEMSKDARSKDALTIVVEPLPPPEINRSAKKVVKNDNVDEISERIMDQGELEKFIESSLARAGIRNNASESLNLFETNTEKNSGVMNQAILPKVEKFDLNQYTDSFGTHSQSMDERAELIAGQLDQNDNSTRQINFTKPQEPTSPNFNRQPSPSTRPRDSLRHSASEPKHAQLQPLAKEIISNANTEKWVDEVKNLGAKMKFINEVNEILNFEWRDLGEVNGRIDRLVESAVENGYSGSAVDALFLVYTARNEAVMRTVKPTKENCGNPVQVGQVEAEILAQDPYFLLNNDDEHKLATKGKKFNGEEFDFMGVHEAWLDYERLGSLTRAQLIKILDASPLEHKSSHLITSISAMLNSPQAKSQSRTFELRLSRSVFLLSAPTSPPLIPLHSLDPLLAHARLLTRSRWQLGNHLSENINSMLTLESSYLHQVLTKNTPSIEDYHRDRLAYIDDNITDRVEIVKSWDKGYREWVESAIKDIYAGNCEYGVVPEFMGKMEENERLVLDEMGVVVKGKFGRSSPYLYRKSTTFANNFYIMPMLKMKTKLKENQIKSLLQSKVKSFLIVRSISKLDPISNKDFEQDLKVISINKGTYITLSSISFV